MRKFLISCLLLALSLPAIASDGNPVKYVGGTIQSLSAGGQGQFNTVSDTALIFEYSGQKLEIPYASIDSWDYSHEVRRHLGVLPAIFVALLRARSRQHFLRITYHDQNNHLQVGVFEIPKQ